MPDGQAAGTVLAFDFGLRHIGVAVGQSISRTASPVTTVRARHGKPDWATIDPLIASWQPGRLLVGLPLNMDGTESEMSQHARRFANRLEKRYGLDVALVDERLTSRESRTLGGRNAHAKRRATPSSHSLSAVLIAESWLNAGS